LISVIATINKTENLVLLTVYFQFLRRGLGAASKLIFKENLAHKSS